ncbi:PAS domain-containing hybrid sensor histidine kinase/response regulator [Gemmatimonas sp.]|uniref:PAS domain-containing hybrid sensor histidine kinase/response regulator n=1 Tax=Gemmatimonas sp. TaxID=1962908 RepID=UPI003F701BB3
MPIIYGGILALLLAIAAVWRVASVGELAALGFEAMAAGIARLLIQRQQLRAAVWLVVLAIVFGSVALVLSFGSMRTVGTFGFVFAVTIAAVFLPRREIAAIVIGVWVAILALTWIEVSRVTPSAVRPFSWPHAIILSMGMLFVSSVVGYARSVAVAAVRKQQVELDERHRAEERLRLSMEATRQGWFDLDLATGVVAASPQFARLIGATPGDSEVQLTREAWIAAIHHDDRTQVMERLDRCLRTGETERIEYRLKGLDGSFRWIRSTAKVVAHDGAGRPARLTGTHADITDQMATTLALESSERSYRALVEMSPVGVMVVREGDVRYANPAAVGLMGATDASELLGVPVRSFLLEDPPSWLLSPGECLTSRPEGAPAPMELLLRGLKGNTFEASTLCTPLIHEGASSLQVSFTDISAQKSAEAARLTSRQLEALGTLAGGIAHDFNNILLAIRGNAELVANEPGLSVDGAEQLREILLAGQRASELVRRITTFARPREPHQELIQLRDVLDEVLRLLRPTVPAGISFVVHTDDPVLPIMADAAAVHETIVNLTTNAVYAIGSGRVGEVTFAVDHTMLQGDAASVAGVVEGQYTRLTVHDTGPGMSSETQRRLFDAFYTTKPVGEGSGLGLSMAYGIMRSHGGTITVSSREGHGATFQLLFPSVEGVAVAPPALSPVRAATSTSKRVLFVDDEPPLVRLAHRTLTPLGHTVTSFTCPLEALEAFRVSPDAFDVVITDLSMPRMSGLALAKTLRREGAAIPIVMVTGYSDDVDEAEALAAGVTRVAVKAATAQQLPRLLAEVAHG